MKSEVSCLVGGMQGEGIESVGEILAKALGRNGYYLFGYRNFSSRIKGGHSDFHLRIGKDPVYNASERFELILAFDHESIELHQRSLIDGGVILFDPKTVKIDQITIRGGIQSIAFPFSDMAAELGSKQMKNMVAVGAACALFDQPIGVFGDAVREQFAKKGEAIVEKNMAAVKKGHEFLQELMDTRFPLEKQPQSGQRLFLSGNDAISIGAVLGGCRFMAGYPITPASDILENLVQMLPNYGGVAVQTEDELAAIAMVIGAGYAGTRAMTATAGPGISLMQEAIGLAGATETPIVIVDTQRGGPSSGMATKIEQSDLHAMITGTHGEAPRIVLAPSTVEEAMLDMPKAFNLAEKYQCPVFVASDLVLSTSKQTCEMANLQLEDIQIDRGKRVAETELAMSGDRVYKRFAITDDGITARSIPGQKKGMHHVTGIEHGPTGHPSENPANRVAQMSKRARKLQCVPMNDAIKYEGIPQAEVLLIGFGSTYGAIREARLWMQKEGAAVGHVHVRMLHPLPAAEISQYTEKAKTIIVVEQNSTGQLANLLKQHISIHAKLHPCLKFDGVPISPSEITSFCRELI
ncbi:2-oxoacid:acceptor oxidoreductase subunit alpha [Ammoniphilus resinae]|uniref:2-oxoacid:acceptor oxidoreductase subunit alpha n=1 Tax=Ammoniphilus resinae TaxID=861532 RepID=UPI001AE1122B